MKNLSPIVVFVYNRLDHTRKTIEALQKNFLASQSRIFIYCDGSKSQDSLEKVTYVRDFVKNIKGFSEVTVIERDENFGLSRSIIEGVSEIINKYNKAIVLEDDLVSSPHFLTYMNEGLNLYENEKNIASIHGYVYPLKNEKRLGGSFFIRGADCWGWATWKHAWDKFNSNGQELLNKINKLDKKNKAEFNFSGHYNYTSMLAAQVDGKIDSWAIRWYASAFLENMLTLYPEISLIQNIGNDETGTHSSNSNIFDTPLVEEYSKLEYIEVKELTAARILFEEYFRSTKRPIGYKLKSAIKKFLHN